MLYRSLTVHSCLSGHLRKEFEPPKKKRYLFFYTHISPPNLTAPVVLTHHTSAFELH